MQSAKGFCLGKLPKRSDPTVRKFLPFVNELALPAAPPARDWLAGLPPNSGVLGNDTVGDCTTAAGLHLIQIWTAGQGNIATVTTQQALAAYSAVSGYTPSTPTSDRGASLLDVMNYWRDPGLAGHEITTFFEVDHTNHDVVKIAINLFGGLYVGVQLPLAAQDLSKPWTGVSGSLTGANAYGSWGGHCVAAGRYDRDQLGLVTWGVKQPCDWLWWDHYVDECWAVLSPDWVNTGLVAPNGFDIERLTTALGAV